jgi:general secretion pathway protein H
MGSNDARSATRAAGFTLIEILVVVVIMAIVISMAVLSINTTGRDQQLDQESMRIEGLLNLLHDRALVEGRDFGMRVQPGAYEFVYYDGIRGRWMRFDQEREFRHRELPKGVSFQLTLDSVKVVLKPPDPDLVKDDTAPPPPQIAVAASGDSSPFRLTLTREQTNATATVTSDTTGKIAVENSSHPPAEKRS